VDLDEAAVLDRFEGMTRSRNKQHLGLGSNK